MSDDGDGDELTVLGRSVDGQLRAVDARVDATSLQLEVLRMDLSGQIDAARRDTARLVLVWVCGSTAITAGLCMATAIVAWLVG